MQLNQRTLLFLQKSLRREGQDSFTTYPETEDMGRMVASLIANGGQFKTLSADPPEFGNPRITDRIRAAGVRDLWNLNALLSWLTVVDAPQHATKNGVSLLRRSWSTLMLWLVYLLDSREGFDDGLSACVHFLLHIFRLKEQLSDLLEQTNQPQMWTMALWLNLAIEVAPVNIRKNTLLERYIPLLRSLNTTMLMLSTPVDSTRSDDYDHESVSKSLAAVEHVSHRVHRQALQNVLNIITATYTAHGKLEYQIGWSDVLDVSDAQLQQTKRFFTEMGVSQVSARDVKVILDIVRSLHGLRLLDNTSRDAIIYTAIDLLASFWDRDHRAIGWAIRSGVIEYMVESLVQSGVSEANREAFFTNLITVVTWTVHFPIAVHFHKKGASESIALLAGKDKHGVIWAQVHAELMKRCALVEKFYKPRCDNYRCPKLIPPDEMRAKCCQCYEVYYCSRACQRQHWGMHRLFCPFIGKRLNRPSGHYSKTGPEIHIDGGYVKRKGAFFVAQLVQDSLRYQGEEILSAVRTEMEENPEGKPIRDFALFFDFDGNVRPEFTAQAYPVEEGDPHIPPTDPNDLAVYVYARLPPARRGEDPAPFIEVTVMSLWELNDMVEHFRACKNHAACVTRTQARPPRCEKLEILGRQCDECIYDFGVDDDPWNGLTARERKWGTY